MKVRTVRVLVASLTMLGISVAPVLAGKAPVSAPAPAPGAKLPMPAPAPGRSPRALRAGATYEEHATFDLAAPVFLHVQITDGFNPKTAKVGTAVHGRLLEDLVIDGEKVASAGDRIDGAITKMFHGKRTIKSYLPNKHFLNAQGRLFITFGQIEHAAGKGKVTIHGGLEPKTEVELAKPSKLHLVVNKDGELTVKYAIAKYLAVDALVGGAVLATGPVGMLVAPAVTGTVGAFNPSYANGRPVDSSEKQSRLKNFVLGAGRGVPGASIVFGLATKGLDVGLHPGDRLEVQLPAHSVVAESGV